MKNRINMDLNAAQALKDVLAGMGLAHLSTDHVRIHGSDPVIPSRFKLGSATAGALAAQAMGIAEIWRLRSGRGQGIEVDLAQAAYPGLCTFLHISQNGHRIPFTRWNGQGPNFFETRDGRRFYLLYTANYVQHCLDLHRFLGASTSPESLARAVQGWEAFDLEEALAERKLIGAVARTREEWLCHPQGALLSEQSPAHLDNLGPSDPEPLLPAPRPLAGVRVLDMTHVLAGPVTARLLAEQGAEVIHVAAAYQPDGLLIDLDTGLGKRTAYLDLERRADREHLRELIRGADVFVQSWRPGSLARRGFSAEEIAALRPGIVQASLSCYGSDGPWASRGGYEPIGQTVSGLAIGEGTAEQPVLACTFTLNDYLTAYLAAAGIVGALIKRSARGGSYHVKASLTRTSMWVQELGRLPEQLWPGQSGGVCELPPIPEEHFQETESVFGTLRHPRPIVRYEETQSRWGLPPSPPGAGKLDW